jgi:hypothetical protein
VAVVNPVTVTDVTPDPTVYGSTVAVEKVAVVEGMELTV